MDLSQEIAAKAYNCITKLLHRLEHKEVIDELNRAYSDEVLTILKPYLPQEKTAMQLAEEKRVAMGMTGKDFAKVLGIYPGALYSLQIGRFQPSEKTLQRINEFLGKGEHENSNRI
jgi:Helix-turn-helix.